MNLKSTHFPFSILVLLTACTLLAQDTGPAPAQGASIPGLGAISSFNGPGYLEFGGGYSDMYPRPYSPWKEGYVRFAISGGRNTLTGEASRQRRYGDDGWFYGLGLARDLSDNWFADAHLSSSAGGFFLPKYRADASINRKLLANKQLVLSATGGYDKSKEVNRDYRYGGGFTYYTPWSLVGQGGVSFTHSNPGHLTDMSEYFALTQGHDKEHFLTARVQIGREGYEVVANQNVIQDFDFREYSGTWKQWVGVNWGLNIMFDHENTPFYRRNGGTVGIFFEF